MGACDEMEPRFATLEGGGSRCFFTLGALQVLAREGARFWATAGVSAGAVCGLLAYAGKVDALVETLGEVQRSIALAMVKKIDITDVHALLAQVGRDLRLGVAEGYMKARVADSDVTLYAGTTSVAGKRVWHKNGDDFDRYLRAVGASCTMPGYSRPVNIDGVDYVDGAVFEGLAFDVAPEDAKHLAIFTKPIEYVLQKQNIDPRWRAGSQDYPGLVDALDWRPERYNAVRYSYRYMEEHGQAICIYPDEQLDIGVLEFREKPLRAMVDLGRRAAEARLERYVKEREQQRAAGWFARWLNSKR